MGQQGHAMLCGSAGIGGILRFDVDEFLPRVRVVAVQCAIGTGHQDRASVDSAGDAASVRDLAELFGRAGGVDGRSILVTGADGALYSYNSNAWQKLVDVAAKDPSYPG